MGDTKIPDEWEHTPNLSPDVKSRAFRSKQYPALVMVIECRASSYHVKLKFSTGDDNEAIDSFREETYGDAFDHASRIMGIVEATIIGADDGNKALREYLKGE